MADNAQYTKPDVSAEKPFWIHFEPGTGDIYTLYDFFKTPKDLEDDLVLAQARMKGETNTERLKNYEQFLLEPDFSSDLLTDVVVFEYDEFGKPILQNPNDTDARAKFERPKKEKDKQTDQPEQEKGDRANADRPEQEGNDIETEDLPEKHNDLRSNSDSPEVSNPGDKNEIDWTRAALAAGKTLALGAAVTAGAAAAVAAGVVSAPFLIAAGIGLSIGLGINTFFVRANEALEAGEDDKYLGRAISAGISDVIPFFDPVGIQEAVSGKNYMTQQVMSQQERSDKTGNVIGAAGLDIVPIGGIVAKVKKKNNYEHDIDPHIITAVVTNKERHHAVLQALFKRMDKGDEAAQVLASFIHEGPSHPIPVKLHQDIHRELNKLLRQNGFLEWPKQKKRASLSTDDFRKALILIEKFYNDKYNQKPGKFKSCKEMAETTKSFRLTLEQGGFFK